MILSNVEIHRAIDERRLFIEPEPLPRVPTGASGESCPYQTSSVDLRLGDQISYFREGLPLDINLTRGGFAQLSAPMSETQTITQGQPFVLRPNRLILGKTLEKVTLPIVPEVIACSTCRRQKFLCPMWVARSLYCTNNSFGIFWDDYVRTYQSWPVQYLTLSGNTNLSAYFGSRFRNPIPQR